MSKTKVVVPMKPLSYRVKKYRFLIPIALAGMIYFFIFNYIPIIWGFLMSFKDVKVGSGIMKAEWVGLENYKYVFTNPEMFKLLKNTLRLSVSRLIFSFFPPIILTVIIFDIKSALFKKFSQTMIYIPHFFSWVIIYGIVYAFFSGQGFVNSIITMFGGEAKEFLTSSSAFVPLIVGSQVWKGAGWGTILYFAALTGVNPELYEAAKIDGAGPIARIRAVTLPAMTSVITFNLIMSLGSILNNDFEQVLLFYSASVYDVGDIIDTWVYRVGLGKMNYSVGSAVSMLKAVISLVLMLTANKIAKKTSGRAMF